MRAVVLAYFSRSRRLLLRWEQQASHLLGFLTLVSSTGFEAAEKTVLLLLNPGSEKEDVGRPSGLAIAERQRPETMNSDRLALGVSELATEGVGAEIKSIDAAIAKVAHEQVLAESAEIPRGEGQPPGRVEFVARSDAPNEVALGIEDSDEAVALARYIIALGGVLFGIGDIELTVQILDVEGRKPVGDVRVREGTGEAGRSKVLVEHIDGASMEIGGVEKVARGSAADGQPFVDCVGG